VAIDNYQELNLDVHLQLLSGMPMKVKNAGEIRPKTIREVVEYGYTNYVNHLNLFTLYKEDFVKEEFLDKIEFGIFDLMLGVGEKEFLEYLKESIEYFLNQRFFFSTKRLALVSYDNDDVIITSENYEELRNVIRWQSGITQSSKDKAVAFKNERAKRIYERLNKTKEEVQKYKQTEDDKDLDIADIISAISSKSFSLNKFNVFDLTFYQLYDEFKRLDLIDSYQVTIQALMQGAKNVTLKHWTTNIKD
jgi:hypothetical protein